MAAIEKPSRPMIGGIFGMVAGRLAGADAAADAVMTSVLWGGLLYNQRLTTIWAGTDRPFFLGRPNSLLVIEIRRTAPVALLNIVQQVVTGLGYELVEIERSAGGLLRVTIDWPWVPELRDERSVTVEDCERVTRQLQFALEVEGVDYRRLEVSSPGIDRLLRGRGDFERFLGAVVDVVLKAPIGKEAAAGVGIGAGRKKFRGVLAYAGPQADGVERWRLVWRDEPKTKPGARVGKRRAAATVQAMDFALDEIREARLAPVVDFKGRGSKSGGEPPYGDEFSVGRSQRAGDAD